MDNWRRRMAVRLTGALPSTSGIRNALLTLGLGVLMTASGDAGSQDLGDQPKRIRDFGGESD